MYGLPTYFTLVDPEITDEFGECQADPRGSGTIIANRAGVPCMKVQFGRLTTDTLVDRGFMFEAYVSKTR